MMRHEYHDHHHDHHHPKPRHHSHTSRREVLIGLGAAGLAAAVARPSLADALKPVADAVPPQAPSAGPLFRIERVTEGVYAAIARPASMLNCNAAIIVGTDHVLVVDTHSKPSAAQALISQIRAEVSPRPVRYVINSHFHWDHAQGNPAYPSAFPQSEIISSMATREWLAREGAPRLRQSLDSLPKQIADLRSQLAAAKTAGERTRLSTSIAELEAYLKEMTPPEKQIALPTITFDERLVVHPGGREVHLLFLGRGHTAGDVVVHIPGERAVATGDLMHGILPYLGDAYPDEWPRTLAALERLDFNRVVPGHGSVQQGKAVLAFFRSYVEELNEAVSRGVERGASLAELQRTLEPDRLRSLQADGQRARVEREAVALLGPVPDPATLLKGAVATNVAEVYTYYTKRRGR
jgi:glyoxylase-like metal-dependent hydrolase (beta-lactamase superfamily II)